MIVWHVPQRSPEWMALRAGKLTGSCAKDMLASIRSGEAAARRDLRYRLIAERLTKTSQEDGYINAAMQWGIDQEAEAIAAYETATGHLVNAVGFCQHGEFTYAGTSPDGLIAEDGIVSIKCPKTATHLRYLRDGGEPAEHAPQNTHEFWITGRQWLDFVSYDPRLPDRLQLHIVRIERDEDRIAEYAKKAVAFLDDVANEVACLETASGIGRRLALVEA